MLKPKTYDPTKDVIPKGVFLKLVWDDEKKQNVLVEAEDEP